MILKPDYGTQSEELWSRMLENGYDIPNIFLDIIYKSQEKLNFTDINTFVETGTNYGHTTEVASYHFKEVVSFEKYIGANITTFTRKGKPPYTWKMKERLDELNKYDNITINHEDSIVGLNRYFKENPNKRCVILLDAHNGNDSNLRGELEAIKNSNVKNHIIIIDDLVDLGRGSWPTYNEFLGLVKAISPDYRTLSTGRGRNIYIIY